MNNPLRHTARHLRELAPFWRCLMPRSAKRVDRSRRLVVMLVISNLRIDPRVERAARSAASAGYEVVVICPDISSPSLAAAPLDWGPRVRFHSVPGETSVCVMQPPWLACEALHRAALEYAPLVIHCHDLTTALAGLSAARITRAFAVCDFHEWYSENVSWDAASAAWVAHPKGKRAWFRFAERVALWQADATVTVCGSIADELSRMARPAQRTVDVIRNIPPLSGSGKQYPSLKTELGLGPDDFLLLWQGGTGPSRMLEPIIEALAELPRVTFVIRGPSLDLFGEGYRALADRLGVGQRLVLQPPVPSADVVNAAHGADAGIWTLPKLSKNFYYALPNKIFEYMAAGLPVLAADFPEARKMVVGNGIGLCFDPYDPSSIAHCIRQLAEEPGTAERFRAAVPRALEGIAAETEWQTLPAIYRRLGG
jgi:glycosyltransferase involved in cell wall biosynthesis